MSRSYLPDSDAGLAAWGANFVEKITQNADAWEIPAAEVTNLQNAYGAFMSLYVQTSGPGRNKTLTEAKNEAREAFKAAVRNMANFRLKNPVIPKAGLVDAGVNPGGTPHTPVGAPTEHVGLTIMPTNVRQHKIAWTVEETGRKAVPDGYDGVVLRKGVLEPGAEVPVKPEALPYSTLLTRNKILETFRAEDQGKRCAYAACWQNEKGVMGPWSDIITVLVP
jgi:hypothetical protein